jgi:Holliday junction resolvase
MSGKKSKDKGKTFERDIANYLSELYKDSFTRVPGSGAYVGGQNAVRKEHLTENQVRGFKSDIMPPDGWGHLNIECKAYADFPFHQLFQDKEIPILNTWIQQTYDAADEGDFNLIIMKFNRKGKYVMYELKHHMVTNCGIIYNGWYFCEFDKFFSDNKENVKEYSQKN